MKVRRRIMTGSSPPVRGAPIGPVNADNTSGLIPARAGSTRLDHHQPARNGAHPRPCGEHRRAAAFLSGESGSSPPVRGAPAAPHRGRALPGLIPARAGSTLMRTCARTRSWAHPRPCGEHLPHFLKLPQWWGSSPPVRGARARTALQGRSVGLIPARAGSTTRPDRPRLSMRAHPRPCGEHFKLFRMVRRMSGSSPPVRGAHLLTWGFIPYTGKIGLLWSQSLRPEYTINNCS